MRTAPMARGISHVAAVAAGWECGRGCSGRPRVSARAREQSGLWYQRSVGLEFHPSGAPDFALHIRVPTSQPCWGHISPSGSLVAGLLQYKHCSALLIKSLVSSASTPHGDETQAENVFFSFLGERQLAKEPLQNVAGLVCQREVGPCSWQFASRQTTQKACSLALAADTATALASFFPGTAGAGLILPRPRWPHPGGPGSLCPPFGLQAPATGATSWRAAAHIPVPVPLLCTPSPPWQLPATACSMMQRLAARAGSASTPETCRASGEGCLITGKTRAEPVGRRQASI